MSAIHHPDIEAIRGHLLRQRPDRRDTDSAGDQQHLRVCGRLCELAERAVDKNWRAGPQGVDTAREVPDALDGNAELPAIRDRRDGKRMSLPPALCVEEPPDRELSCLSSEPVHVTS